MTDAGLLARRERLVRLWPYAAIAMLALLVGCGGWLWWKAPLLINPLAVAEAVRAGTLPDATAGLMAAMLPVVTLGLLVVMAVFVVFVTAMFRNERRLLAIVRTCRAGDRR